MCEFDGIPNQAVSGTLARSRLKESPMKGTVKWFNASKGFGFIAPDDGGKDAFVHISTVERAGLDRLTEGQKVEYDVMTDPRTRKSSAQNLKKLA